jgi:hypothetical protein
MTHIATTLPEYFAALAVLISSLGSFVALLTGKKKVKVIADKVETVALDAATAVQSSSEVHTLVNNRSDKQDQYIEALVKALITADVAVPATPNGPTIPTGGETHG